MAVTMLRSGVRSALLRVEMSAGAGAQPLQTKKMVYTRHDGCTGRYCLLSFSRPTPHHTSVARSQVTGLRSYSQRRQDAKQQSDSDSDSDSDTKCKGHERSDFWRRKMRTVHNILDVDKDGLVSFSDFTLFAQRFTEKGHLTSQEADDFRKIVKMTWEEQWGEVAPYNLVTVEQYLEDMHRVLNDKQLKKRAYRWLPYLFQAVDKDKSGFISVAEFRVYFECLGLNSEQAAVAFAVIDTNADGKLSLKEFVKLGKEFFFTNDERKPSRMFWGPLVDH